MVRRVEVITGPERRRRWSEEEKLQLVEEACRPGMSVSLVARQRGINASQLFAWRRAARQQIASPAGPKESVFVPAFVDAAEGAAAGDAAEELPLVGFDLEGASVWVCRGADIEIVRAIIRALKASS